jgi:hypothetical protein
MSRPPSPVPVAKYESGRYSKLEKELYLEEDLPRWGRVMSELVRGSCEGVLKGSAAALKASETWFTTQRDGRLPWVLPSFLPFARKKRDEVDKARNQRIAEWVKARDGLMAVLDEFRKVGRLCILEPYRPAFKAGALGHSFDWCSVPPHRFLFHCYLYQYHLMEFATRVVDLVRRSFSNLAISI